MHDVDFRGECYVRSSKLQHVIGVNLTKNNSPNEGCHLVEWVKYFQRGLAWRYLPCMDCDRGFGNKILWVNTRKVRKLTFFYTPKREGLSIIWRDAGSQVSLYSKVYNEIKFSEILESYMNNKIYKWNGDVGSITYINRELGIQSKGTFPTHVFPKQNLTDEPSWN